MRSCQSARAEEKNKPVSHCARFVYRLTQIFPGTEIKCGPSPDIYLAESCSSFAATSASCSANDMKTLMCTSSNILSHHLNVHLFIHRFWRTSPEGVRLGGRLRSRIRRHCSLISREDQIPAREGRHNNNNDDDISAQPVLSDTREGGGQ
jgi:hypothetical protein